ncbi:MAG TPA: response regulator [Beijerinckiaceae bacterium]|jgi:DNA-binding response OmpR family regulator
MPTALVVEDEVLLAIEIEALLDEAGFEPVGHALKSGDAIKLARELKPDFALVDVHLLDGPTGVDVARRLALELGILVVFMTGNARRVPTDFAGAYGLIEKPYTDSGLLAALRHIQARLSGERTGEPPPALELAPRYDPRRAKAGSQSRHAAE